MPATRYHQQASDCHQQATNSLVVLEKRNCSIIQPIGPNPVHHIALFPTPMSINLQQSKMGLFWWGITIQIFLTGSSMYPIRALTLYSKLVTNNNVTTPVFRAGRFDLLTQQQLNNSICCLLQRGKIDQESFASHSFELARPSMLLLGYQLG